VLACRGQLCLRASLPGGRSHAPKRVERLADLDTCVAASALASQALSVAESRSGFFEGTRLEAVVLERALERAVKRGSIGDQAATATGEGSRRSIVHHPRVRLEALQPLLRILAPACLRHRLDEKREVDRKQDSARLANTHRRLDRVHCFLESAVSELEECERGVDDRVE
jgi:hypothetical protein